MVSNARHQDNDAGIICSSELATQRHGGSGGKRQTPQVVNLHERRTLRRSSVMRAQNHVFTEGAVEVPCGRASQVALRSFEFADVVQNASAKSPPSHHKARPGRPSRSLLAQGLMEKCNEDNAVLPSSLPEEQQAIQ
jgi:hypothetical protein